MKIKINDQGITGELEVPGPIQQDGKWWEFKEFRTPQKFENYLVKNNGKIHCAPWNYFINSYWIASEIPEPPPEQLRAIWMRCPAGRPMVVKDGDCIWNGKRQWNICKENDPKKEHIGRYRFVLAPVGEQTATEPEVHISCKTCSKFCCGNSQASVLNDNGGINCPDYTPKQSDEDKNVCLQCGKEKCTTRNVHVGWCSNFQATLQKEENLLLDAARCLDDCLIRIYPEEFSREDVEASAKRFLDNGGTIARIAGLADELRMLAKQPNEDTGNDTTALAVKILRNWSRENIVRFATHLLGDKCQQGQAQPTEPRYSVDEFKKYLDYLSEVSVDTGEAAEYVDNPSYGIRAVTERQGK